jgi:hypothetical protein
LSRSSVAIANAALDVAIANYPGERFYAAEWDTGHSTVSAELREPLTTPRGLAEV